MKFNDFKNSGEMLLHFGLKVKNSEFINLDAVPVLEIPSYLKEDIDFVLAERGDSFNMY